MDFLNDAMIDHVVSAPVFDKSIYTPPGTFLYEVQKFDKNSGSSGNFLIVNLKVVEGRQNGEINRKEGQPYPVAAPGDVRSFMSKVTGTQGNDPGAGNFMKLFLTLINEDPKKLGKDPKVTSKVKILYKAAFSPFNPFEGVQVRDVAFDTQQKKDTSKDWTNHNWTHVPPSPELEARIKQRVQAFLEDQKKRAAQAAQAAAASAPASAADILG